MTEKPEEGCECCNFETDELEFFEHGAGFPAGSGQWLCTVCSHTVTGNTNRYPAGYSYEHTQTLKTLAYCTNMILQAIKQKAGDNGIACNNG